MSDVSNGADVDGRLARDDIGVEGSEQTCVEVIKGLRSKVTLLEDLLILLLNDIFCLRTYHLELGLGIDLFSHFTRLICN